jgi:hypothetical protein
MNYPTREEHEELKGRVHRLEQQTEPIRISRLEIEQHDASRQLGSVQEDVTILRLDVTSLKVEMRGARADILKIRESQANLRDRLIEQSQNLKAMKDKQDTHSELLEKLINIAESNEKLLEAHDVRFDSIENILQTIPTKDDVAAIRTSQDLILQLLQNKRE